jgi:hypothetical protein
MYRRTAAVALALALSGLCACNSTTSSTTSTAATYTFTPATAVAVPSTDGRTYTIVGDANHPDKIITFPWKTSVSVTIKENSGVGRNVDSVTLKVQQASGGVVLTPTGGDVEHFQYNSPQSAGSRLNGNGSTSLSFDVWYDLPNGGRTALISLVFGYTDDNKAVFSEGASVQVQ